MMIPDEIRLGVEIVGLVATGGTILFKLGRLGERFEGHATKLDKVEGQIDKIEETLQTVAVQKEAIQSIRDAQMQDRTRTDETFRRVFSLLDRKAAG
jgi:hypothetical protein